MDSEANNSLESISHDKEERIIKYKENEDEVEMI